MLPNVCNESSQANDQLKLKYCDEKPSCQKLPGGIENKIGAYNAHNPNGRRVILYQYFVNLKISEYDQEITQSQTADKPMAHETGHLFQIHMQEKNL